MEGIELVLTDWNMPEMDGLTFVKEIKKSLLYSYHANHYNNNRRSKKRRRRGFEKWCK